MKKKNVGFVVNGTEVMGTSNVTTVIKPNQDEDEAT